MGFSRILLGGEALTLEQYRRLDAEGRAPDTATSPAAPRTSAAVPLELADPGEFGPSPTQRPERRKRDQNRREDS